MPDQQRDADPFWEWWEPQRVQEGQPVYSAQTEYWARAAWNTALASVQAEREAAEKMREALDDAVHRMSFDNDCWAPNYSVREIAVARHAIIAYEAARAPEGEKP